MLLLPQLPQLLPSPSLRLLSNRNSRHISIKDEEWKLRPNLVDISFFAFIIYLYIIVSENREKHNMDKVHSSDTLSIGLDCCNTSELTKSIENYLSMMIHPSNGFVKSTVDGTVLPQFPCLLVNYKNRPGPLVTPNLVPTRPVFDIQGMAPDLTQRLGSDGHVSESDTKCTQFVTP